jgi:hypothetical protein
MNIDRRLTVGRSGQFRSGRVDDGLRSAPTGGPEVRHQTARAPERHGVMGQRLRGTHA